MKSLEKGHCMKYIIFSKKIFVAAVFLLFSNSIAYGSTRNMIILFAIPSNPQQLLYGSFDPVSDLFRKALLEQAAPILTSAPIWNNFATRRSIIATKCAEKNELYLTYLALYDLIDQKIRKLAQQPDVVEDPILFNAGIQAISQEVQKKENTDFSRKVHASIDYIKKIRPQDTAKTVHALESYMIEYIFPFSPDQWDIYTNGDLYLLIPHAYINKLDIPMAEKTVTDHTTKRPLSDYEIRLGLKVNNWEKVVATDTYQLPVQQPEKPLTLNYNAPLPLDSIFITKKDFDLETEQLFPFVWNIYIAAHSNRPFSSAQITSLDTLIQKSQILYKTVQDQISIFAAQTPQALYQQLMEQKDTSLKTGNLTTDQKQQYDTVLAQTQELADNTNAINKIISSSALLIAGLPLPVFSALLNFFNNELVLDILSYLSCHSGAQNLILPYLSTFMVEQNYHFTIIGGTMTDLPTYSFTKKFSLLECEEFSGKKVTIPLYNDMFIFSVPPIPQFSRFFNALQPSMLMKKPTTLNTLIGYLHRTPRELSRIYNIPVVRYPGSTAFSSLDIEENTTVITKTLLSTRTQNGIFAVPQKEVVILYTYYIPVTLKLSTTKIMPSLKSAPIFYSGIHKPTAFGTMAFYIHKIICPTTKKDMMEKLLHSSKGISLRPPTPFAIILDSLELKNKDKYSNIMALNKLSLSPAITLLACEKIIMDNPSLFSGFSPESLAPHVTYKRAILYSKKVNQDDEKVVKSFADLAINIPASNSPKPFKYDITIELSGQAAQDYHAIFDGYKKEIKASAKQDTMMLIPTQAIKTFVKKHKKKVQKKPNT